MVETTCGRFGVELSRLDRHRGSGVVLPWADRRWISPSERIRFSAPDDLTGALITAGVPQAEAASLAHMVLEEWEVRLAGERRRPSGPAPKTRIGKVVMPALLLALWTTGAAYIVLRVWRALR